MPSVPATTSTTTSTSAPAGTAASTLLGKDEFLKLLVGQLKNQDPLNPTTDTDFIGQMAQFAQLEQTTNMATANERLVAEQRGARAVALLGRTVTYPDATTGVPTTGVVQRVDWLDGRPSLSVGGAAGIEPDSVTAVQ
ncbi:MAG TPA: flagellar hook capping FlgD N-terminal domain-containing protein [Solirubrobacteraceae bacterium]|nr:flagellar hook capping FlgD N-terminal domain-containing protein [Solirubrobacteraceae bacterium]